MTGDFYNNTLVSAIEKYGFRSQQTMCIEEMAELTKAICKYWRNNNKKTYEDVLEEMADVEIMLDQMKIMFGDPHLRKIKEQKIHRLFHRLTKIEQGEEE